MKMRRSFSVVLGVGMAMSLFLGCGGSEGAVHTEDTSAGQEISENSSGISSDSVLENADEDLAEINMIYMSMSTLPSGLSDIEAAINEITESEINTHVNIEVIEVGNYAQQIGLKMSSSEVVDLMVTLPTASAAAFSVMASQGQLLDITEELAEYGQGITSTVGDLVKATTVDGAVYGVPTYRDLVTSTYIAMRTDVLEDLGLLEKAENMTTFTEYEEILETVKNSDKWDSLVGIVAVGTGEILAKPGSFQGVDAFADAKVFDQLGDMNKLICIDPEGEDPTIRNYYATDEYRAMYDIVKGWYDKGYIYKDANTTKETGSSLVKSNVAFSMIVSGDISVEVTQTGSCGYDMTCVKIVTQPLSTYNCQKFVWVVPSTAAEPEAAVKMMNLMYTDERICNLLAWGIEDVHYTVKDGIAYFAEGTSADNTAYHMVDFTFGNQFLVLPWEGSDPEIREKAKEAMDNAPISAYLGFSCDTTDISTDLASVINTINEYRPSIESGMASEADYEAFLEKLEVSGAQAVVDTYQEQLNAWLANN